MEKLRRGLVMFVAAASLLTAAANLGRPAGATVAPREGWPSWSPDGQSIVFERGSFGSTRLVVADVKTGRIRALNLSGSFPEWSRDGASIAFEGQGGGIE